MPVPTELMTREQQEVFLCTVCQSCLGSGPLLVMCLRVLQLWDASEPIWEQIFSPLLTTFRTSWPEAVNLRVDEAAARCWRQLQLSAQQEEHLMAKLFATASSGQEWLQGCTFGLTSQHTQVLAVFFFKQQQKEEQAACSPQQNATNTVRYLFFLWGSTTGA